MSFWRPGINTQRLPFKIPIIDNIIFRREQAGSGSNLLEAEAKAFENMPLPLPLCFKAAV
jgi:hypothetical protein